jgi:hypothetical protein
MPRTTTNSADAVNSQVVLTADLRWKQLTDLTNGNEIVSFDDPDLTDTGAHSKLHTRPIVSTRTLATDAVRITTDRGELTVAANQPLLSKYHGFRDAARFRPGQGIRFVTPPHRFEPTPTYKRGYVHGAFAGDGMVFSNDTTKIASIRCQDNAIIDAVNAYAPPEYGLQRKPKTSTDLFEIRTTEWARVDRIDETYPIDPEAIDDPEYCRGWLAGMFDTDGAFDGHAVRFTQKNEQQRHYLKSLLEFLKYDWVSEPAAIRVRGTGERFRILSEIRPHVSRKIQNYRGRSWKGTATVTDVEQVGRTDIVSPTIDGDQTFVLSGFCTRDTRQTTLTDT